MSELRIAFLILAHSDAPQLERLCRALQPHSIFIHVDGKAKHFSVEGIVGLPRVTLVKYRAKVHWGDFSMIDATLALIEEARGAGSFDRYVLLSGACYPVKTMASLESAFEDDPRREWMNLTKINPDSHLANLISRRWRMAPLVRQTSVDARLRSVWNRISKIMGRDLEREIQMTPYFGSQWWALTENCMAMIVECVKSNPALMRAYCSVYAPDEHFFQTIVGNSCFAAYATQVPDCGRATNQAMPLHLTSTTEDRCWVAGEGALAEIATSGKFFIRKVSANRSFALLDRIDAELLHPTSS